MSASTPYSSKNGKIMILPNRAILDNLIVYDTDDTYIPSEHVQYIDIEMVGAGGAGGGYSDGITAYGVGSGGGAGAYIHVRKEVSSGQEYPVIVGVGGSDSAGGNTEFDDLLAEGGYEGSFVYDASNQSYSKATGVDGGAYSINEETILTNIRCHNGCSGCDGITGFTQQIVATYYRTLQTGNGGSGPFGFGGSGLLYTGSSLTSDNGRPAVGYGSGGGGAYVNGTSGNVIGGAGTGGIVYIREYYA